MKIMVTLDGSEFAEAVVEPVAQLAVNAKAEVFLVRVVEPSEVHSTWVGSPEYYAEAAKGELTPLGQRIRSAGQGADKPRAVESYDQALDRAIEEARDYLHHVAGRFGPLQSEAVVLVGDDIDDELAKFARQRHVELIAMSSHGRTGLARLVMGSHANRMLRYQIAPLMIVRPDNLHQTEEKARSGAEETTIS